MKHVLCASLASCLFSILPAAEAVRVDTELYVFRDADFSQILAADGTPIATGHGELIGTPGLVFDDHRLELGGPALVWDEPGKPAPAQFSPVATPAITVSPRQEATVLCALPVQYLEKTVDGRLQVRKLERDSGEVPHYQFTFVAHFPDYADAPLLSCRFAIATLAGREKIPGVELDAGRPILARLEDKFQFSILPGTWAGIVLRRPNGTEQSMVLLFKVTAAPGAAGAIAADQPMRPDELDHFATYYYRNPRPERIADAIAALPASGFAEEREHVFTGFFAAVFAANPGRVDAWRKVIGRQDWTTRSLLRRSLRAANPEALVDRGRSSAANDFLWGAYFASGDPVYLHRLADNLKWIDDGRWGRFWTGATAKWSLARNAAEHPQVRAVLTRYKEEVDARTRELIDDVLTKDPADIRAEIVALREQRAPRGYVSGVGPINQAGDGRILNVGPAAGLPPPTSYNMVPQPAPGPIR